MITKEHMLINAKSIQEREGVDSGIVWTIEQYEKEIERLQRRIDAQKRTIFKLMNY